MASIGEIDCPSKHAHDMLTLFLGEQTINTHEHPAQEARYVTRSNLGFCSFVFPPVAIVRRYLLCRINAAEDEDEYVTQLAAS